MPMTLKPLPPCSSTSWMFEGVGRFNCGPPNNMANPLALFAGLITHAWLPCVGAPTASQAVSASSAAGEGSLSGAST